MATRKIDIAEEDLIDQIGTDTTGGQLAASHEVQVSYSDSISRLRLIKLLKLAIRHVEQDSAFPNA